MSTSVNNKNNGDFILTGTIIGTDDKNKVIEKMRKKNSKQDELTKLALEEAIKVADNKQFGNTKELENFLNQELQTNIKKYDPISIMADLEEAEDDEDKIISPDMDADFQKIVPTQGKATTAKYNDITRINDYINLAKTRSERLEKQMEAEKNILPKLDVQKQKLIQNYRKLLQKQQQASQQYSKAEQQYQATLRKYDEIRRQTGNTDSTEKVKKQVEKDKKTKERAKEQLNSTTAQLSYIASAYNGVTNQYNNTLASHKSHEYVKNLADKLVKQYGDIADHLEEQRKKILKQASETTSDIISALETQSGKPLTAERRSEIFQTHLSMETQNIYNYYLNLRQGYSAIKNKAQQEIKARAQQQLELEQINKQITTNKQTIEQLKTQELSLKNKIDQAKEDLSKNKNTNEQQLQTYNKMLEEYRQLKQKYHTLITDRDKLEDKQARLKYDLQPEEKKQQATISQEERELQAFLDAPTEEEKKSAETRARQAESNEGFKNFRNSRQTKYTYEAYIQNKKKSEASNPLNTNLQPQTQQQKQNVENKPFNNYFYSGNYLYSNYLKSMPLSSQSPNSAKQRNRNANNRYNIYNRYMLAYLRLNNAKPQIGLQQYNAYKMLRGKNNNLNINIKPQAKGTQQNYFQSYRSYISRITSKGTSNGWTRQF